MSAAIGDSINRVDGFLKTTGGARYAADYYAKDAAFGVPVVSTIAKGKVVKIDTVAAERQECETPSS